jgi:hypothetical protein
LFSLKKEDVAEAMDLDQQSQVACSGEASAVEDLVVEADLEEDLVEAEVSVDLVAEALVVAVLAEAGNK